MAMGFTTIITIIITIATTEPVYSTSAGLFVEGGIWLQSTQKRAADWWLFSFAIVPLHRERIALKPEPRPRPPWWKSVAGADKSARCLHGLTDIARNRDGYQIIAAETVFDRIECSPAHLKPGVTGMLHIQAHGLAGGPARSALSKTFAASSDDAGFCPVISGPSTTTWGRQSPAFE